MTPILHATNIFASDGTTLTYEINFTDGYLKPYHVKAYSAPEDTPCDYTPITFTLLGPYTAVLDEPVPIGHNIIIRRETEAPAMTNFEDGARITETALDLAARQGLFKAVEALDRVNSCGGGAGGGGEGPPGGGDGDGDGDVLGPSSSIKNNIAVFADTSGKIIKDGLRNIAQIDAAIAAKQDTLVSGVNIKTVNGNTLLGPGNLVIAGGGGGGGGANQRINFSIFGFMHEVIQPRLPHPVSPNPPYFYPPSNPPLFGKILGAPGYMNNDIARTELQAQGGEINMRTVLTTMTNHTNSDMSWTVPTGVWHVSWCIRSFATADAGYIPSLTSVLAIGTPNYLQPLGDNGTHLMGATVTPRLNREFFMTGSGIMVSAHPLGRMPVTLRVLGHTGESGLVLGGSLDNLDTGLSYVDHSGTAGNEYIAFTLIETYPSPQNVP